MIGHIKEYVRVVDGERIYELIVTDHEQPDPNDIWANNFETMVFISEKRNNTYYLLDCLSIPGLMGTISGGLILVDVNFDGSKDILVSLGHFGAQGLVRFACYLSSNDTFILNESFSNIPNPSLDVTNNKVLGTMRNWAASHSWMMYSYINGEFIKTDRLTEEPEIWEKMGKDGLGVEVEVWKKTIEHFSNGNIESEIYLTSDYTDEEWIAMFYCEDSFWGLFSDKWRTLYNQGTLLNWSIYGGGLDADAQIIEIISN